MLKNFVNGLESEMVNSIDHALLTLSRKASDIQMRLRRKELVGEEELTGLAILAADALGAFRLKGIACDFQKDYEEETR